MLSVIVAVVIWLSASISVSLVRRLNGTAYSPTPRFDPVALSPQNRPSTSPRPIPNSRWTFVLTAPPQVPFWTASRRTPMEAPEGTTRIWSFG